MSKDKEMGPAVNPQNVVIALGIGGLLAPFTGGASLLYAGATLASWSLVDLYTKGQTLPLDNPKSDEDTTEEN